MYPLDREAFDLTFQHGKKVLRKERGEKDDEASKSIDDARGCAPVFRMARHGHLLRAWRVCESSEFRHAGDRGHGGGCQVYPV